MTRDEVPVDFNALARKIAAEEARARREDTIQLITFVANTEPGRTTPVGRHPVTNAVVFPDAYRLGGEIKAGETYFCELTDHDMGDGRKVHYANPIRRVDASFLFDLRAEQVAAIVEALQGSALSTLLEQAKVQIQAQVQEALRPRMDALAIERDAAKADAERARGETERLQEANAALKRQVEGFEAKAASEAPAPVPAEVPAPQVPAGWMSLGGPARQRIRRTGEEQLESPVFRDGHYYAHVSPDRRLLFLHAHAEGNLPAIGGKLRVPGLGILRPFARAEELVAQEDVRNGGWLVDISAAA